MNTQNLTKRISKTMESSLNKDKYLKQLLVSHQDNIDQAIQNAINGCINNVLSNLLSTYIADMAKSKTL